MEIENRIIVHATKIIIFFFKYTDNKYLFYSFWFKKKNGVKMFTLAWVDVVEHICG